MSLTLVLGGTRSGKSAHAERLAAAHGKAVHYVATAPGDDPSMAERIAAHASRRPSIWTLTEAGDELSAALPDGGCCLVDGLGAWLGGVLHRAGLFERPDPAALAKTRELIQGQLEQLVVISGRVDVIVVAEEAGQGLLPAEAASRAWLDMLGEATQMLSAAAQRVELVVAGRAIRLTAPGLATPATAETAPATAEISNLRHHGDRDVRPGDIDHAVNVLAGGPPPWLKDALAQALTADASRYPDERPAMRAVAAMHGRDHDEVVITNGAAEALWLLGPALRPSKAVCIHPGFTETEAGLCAFGIPVTRVLRDPDSAFAVDPQSVPDDADLVVVGNPASPSGTLDPATALLALRKPGRIVVVDEAFMGMIPGEPCSLAGERLDDVIVIRSLTKILSIPGLRVGYALAAAPLAERLRTVRPPWSANALALAALEVASNHRAELSALADRADAERTDLEQRLQQIPGLRIWPSATNFCLIEVPDGHQLAAALREDGIAVRPAGTFPGLSRQHVRVTARDPAANERLATLIAAALA